MQNKFNTLITWISLCLSLGGLGLATWASSRIHPPQPVIISCTKGMEDELKRAGEQLESLAAKVDPKTVQHK